MILIIRIVRAVFGGILAFQIIGILPAIMWAANPSSVTGEMLAKLLIKLIVLAIAWGAFSGLRLIVNAIHTKKYGKPHPRLATRKLAL